MGLFKNIFRNRRDKIKFSSECNKCFVDLGASKIKIWVNGKLISYRSSIREVDQREITNQKSAIKVNDKWFIVGENAIDPGAYDYKYQKPNWEVLILYGIMLLKEELKGNDIEINMLLPYTQLSTDKYFKKVLNNAKWNLSNSRGEELTLNTNLNKVLTEGDSSKYYIDKVLSLKGNVVVVNIGYSTTDIAAFNNMNCREKVLSINSGMNTLLVDYLEHTGASFSSELGAWLDDGYIWTSDEEKALEQANNAYIGKIINDLYLGVLRLCNPQNTSIVFCGGGAMALGKSLKSAIANNHNLKKYKAITLKNYDAIYTDLLGAIIWVNDNQNNEVLNNNIDNINEVLSHNIESAKEVAIDNIQLTTKEEKKEKVKELLAQGLNKKEIAKMLNIGYSTVRLYCKE